MANQDVQVKEVDVIRVYNRKFGDFLVSFTEHVNQFQRSLQKRLDEMERAKREIKQERARIEDEIRDARVAYRASFNYDDQAYTSRCRAEYEHLDGPVYHDAQLCESMVHSKLMQSTQAVNMFLQKSDRLKQQYQNYVGNGRVFLEKAAQYIDQYKGQGINA